MGHVSKQGAKATLYPRQTITKSNFLHCEKKTILFPIPSVDNIPTPQPTTSVSFASPKSIIFSSILAKDPKSARTRNPRNGIALRRGVVRDERDQSVLGSFFLFLMRYLYVRAGI